jgi:hypothetical protein
MLQKDCKCREGKMEEWKNIEIISSWIKKEKNEMS